MDVEAYSVVVDLLNQVHGYGESVASKLELWISISSGLIVMAYFAPDRLKIGVTTLVLFAYIAFTTFIITNIGADGALSDAALRDAKLIAEQFDLQANSLDQRLGDAESGRGSTWAFSIFFLILFIGTIGYVAYTAYVTFRNSRSEGT